MQSTFPGSVFRFLPDQVRVRLTVQQDENITHKYDRFASQPVITFDPLHALDPLLKSALISAGLASNCSIKSLRRYPFRVSVDSRSSICRDRTDSTISADMG